MLQEERRAFIEKFKFIRNQTLSFTDFIRRYSENEKQLAEKLKGYKLGMDVDMEKKGILRTKRLSQSVILKDLA